MRKQTCKLKGILSVAISLLMVLSVISLPTFKVKADAGTLDDFIERCYTVTLDRNSDPEGFDYWKGRVLNGDAVGIEVAYGFLFSREYTKKGKTNTEYVKDLYTLFMGREPDDEGFNYWMNKLDEGASRLDIFAGFANSKEFYNICYGYGITAGRYVEGYDRNTNNKVNLYVERMYKICLGRLGDKDGQKNWAEKLVKGQITGSECAQRFIFSTEYTNKDLNDEVFVENLYLAMFGRHSDAEGKAKWLDALDNGNTRDEVFEGFSNSEEFANMCKSYGINKGAYKATHVCPYKVGDIIKLGKYEQDGNLSNGKEDIEWQVLKVEKGKVYVVSKYILEQKKYHSNSDKVTWETCDLRKWLNNDFYNAAFSESEKNMIPSVTVENKDNPYYGQDGGNDTEDKVFLLSLEDIETYFGDYSWVNDEYPEGFNQNLICSSTPYVNKTGIPDALIVVDDSSVLKTKYGYTSDVNGHKSCQWWIRTVGASQEFVLGVTIVGSSGAGENFYTHYESMGVRPAMYISF